ncbi:MAG TPA: S41 family peptidase [Fimbriimonas sp.]|nr:S41 family peptidase [Fimbriimonas sp.]
MLSLLACTLVTTRQLPPPTPSPLIGARSLALSPDGKRIAFSYQGDIWVAPSSGGRAEPVTTNVEMDDNPVWSPDGQYLAFASTRTGNWDIFIVPADGGSTQQLTYNSGADVPSDWSPDGKYVVERASRDSAYNGLYAIDVRTGRTHKLLQDMMSVGSPHYSPDGKSLLYTRFGFPWVRPRYQGSAASQIWKVDLANGERRPIRNTGFQHLWPNYAADGSVLAVTVTEKTPSSSPVGHPIPKIAASDDAERTPNVYQIGSSAKRLTDFVGEGARFLTVAHNAPVAAFERDGDVYLMTIGQAPKKITLTASTDDKVNQIERLVLNSGATDAALSPKGDKIAFTVRGNIWTVLTKKTKGPNADDAEQLTSWEGVDQEPVWAPDNKTIYFLSDRKGPLLVFKMDSDTKTVTPVSSGGDAQAVRVTPDGARISYWQDGPAGGLYTVPIAGGAPTCVLSRPGQYQGDVQEDAYDWSPDGRYIAYSDALLRSGYYYWDDTTNIWLFDTQTNKAVDITKLSASHIVPRFTADGNYLLMRSNRDGDGIYAIPLHQEDAAPGEIEMKFEKPAAPVKVHVDLDGIEDRPRKIVSQAPDGDIQLDPTNGDIYFSSEGDVWRAKYDGSEPKKITNGGVSGFRLSADDTKLLTVTRGGLLNTIDIRKPDTPATTVAFRADWLHDLRKEHAAAYDQFWRAYNKDFYDPNFHGRDWAELGKRYRKFLPSVGTPNEMATILNMLVGELESSHSEVGPARSTVKSETSAHPGFLFDYSYPGPGIKILDVPKGVPGSYEKTKLSAGEVVSEINGKPVEVDEALWRDVLNDQVGRDIDLTVKGADGKTRHVKYKALSNGEFNGIVNRNLLEKRRKYVEDISHGQVTYVHIAGMDGRSLARFNQEVWEYAQGKKAVIVDVRNNGGGNTSDQIIDILERQPNLIYQPRDEKAVLGPGQTLAMPMVVMMAETSYSNAEMFPAAMKARKLATLVGMPTPGYVIYTGGLPLVDGTNARMPGTGVFQLDGTPLEDHGQQPDVKVDITPEEFFAGKDPQLDAAVAALLKQVR